MHARLVDEALQLALFQNGSDEGHAVTLREKCFDHRTDAVLPEGRLVDCVVVLLQGVFQIFSGGQSFVARLQQGAM